MFGIGGPELIIILVVALLVIGPQKLPQMLKGLGKGVAEFKRMGNDVKSTLDMEVERAESEARKKEVDAELAKRKKANEEASNEQAAAEQTSTEDDSASSEPKAETAEAGTSEDGSKEKA
ncbi:Sec-independent protein translocase protein TatB [Salidesulfovibrio brasiliensis]|uniref:Sec-independent protein translocase protein TatB n=1 Tax=Salidesulfovibrio brasiliensis TaxID=221711 RepID=UPI0006D24671|nr:Sec-independent protein translocase protein TatB [Salidesulfovibrio brasiliensis]